MRMVETDTVGEGVVGQGDNLVGGEGVGGDYDDDDDD